MIIILTQLLICANMLGVSENREIASVELPHRARRPMHRGPFRTLSGKCVIKICAAIRCKLKIEMRDFGRAGMENGVMFRAGTAVIGGRVIAESAMGSSIGADLDPHRCRGPRRTGLEGRTMATRDGEA